jgi:hypothetical protein
MAVAEREELLRGELAIRELVAEEHAHDRGDREGVQNPGLFRRREAQARQITEDERQPGAPDEELQGHHQEQPALQVGLNCGFAWRRAAHAESPLVGACAPGRAPPDPFPQRPAPSSCGRGPGERPTAAARGRTQERTARAGKCRGMRTRGETVWVMVGAVLGGVVAGPFAGEPPWLWGLLGGLGGGLSGGLAAWLAARPWPTPARLAAAAAALALGLFLVWFAAGSQWVRNPANWEIRPQ